MKVCLPDEVPVPHSLLDRLVDLVEQEIDYHPNSTVALWVRQANAILSAKKTEGVCVHCATSFGCKRHPSQAGGGPLGR